MRRYCARSLPFLLLSASLLIGADKTVARKWQTGKVLASGNAIQQTAMNTPTPYAGGVRTDDVQAWSVDAGDRVYQILQVRRMGGGTAIRWHYGKAAPISVGEPVTFAVEGDSFYVRDTAGKEWKLHVQHVAMK